MASVLHRRLHLGAALIRKLGERTLDAPSHVSNCSGVDCEHCAAANATRAPHSGSAYAPTHAGRLVHADIAGPFKRSASGSYQYLLLLTDDHTRFKVAYFLKLKSEAPRAIKKFVASFNAHASRHTATPVRVVGTFHSDNAGEFVSREFQEFLSEEGVHRTTSPPHAHQLNGVSERAIRSVMSLVRSLNQSSQVAIGYWPDMVEHAVDVLNRCTGPTEGYGAHAGRHAILSAHAREWHTHGRAVAEVLLEHEASSVAEHRVNAGGIPKLMDAYQGLRERRNAPHATEK